MKDVLLGSSTTRKVLGRQPIDKYSQYRLSHYILIRECSEGYLLFNCLTEALILLDRREYNLLLEWNCLRPEILEQYEFLKGMCERWFLVQVDFDEYMTLIQIRSAIRLICERSTIRTYTILPTTDCNARCFYCFEAKFPRYNMSKQTADKTINFIKCNYSNSPILIRWFGGEPLLGETVIDYICDSIDSQGILFHSRIVTNGHLFSEAMIQKAVSCWHLEEAMITIDGPEELYNKIKNYRRWNGERSPYKVVLDNILSLLDAGVFVEIRLNLDAHNIEKIEYLIDELYIRFKHFHNFHIFTVILHNNGVTAVEHSPKAMEFLYARQRSIEQKLYSMGIGKKEYSVPPTIKINTCMADSRESIIINPLGQLGKCDASIYDGIVGSLESGVLDSSYWESTKGELMDCKLCPMCPSCGTLEHCNAYNPCNEVERTHKIEFAKNSMLRAWDCYTRRR